MQNPGVIRASSRAASAGSSRELPVTFLLLVIVCACVVAAGFFFAARQHFTSMEYGIKNSKLREQLQNLETEKRRLLLAREVALSPLAMRKAAYSIGLHETADVAATQTSSKPTAQKPVSLPAETVKAVEAKASAAPQVVRTAISAPVQPKASGETRGRVVETKVKKEKGEIAALVKFR